MYDVDAPKVEEKNTLNVERSNQKKRDIKLQQKEEKQLDITIAKTLLSQPNQTPLKKIDKVSPVKKTKIRARSEKKI